MVWTRKTVVVVMIAFLKLGFAAQIPTEILEFQGGGNGDTCPPDTIPSGTQYTSALQAPTCAYGEYVGKQGLPGFSKCCFEPDQKVFLLSISSKSTPVTYSFDSVECCPGPDEIPATLANNRCVYGPYGAFRTGVPQKYVTKCCFNKKEKAFTVHLKQFQPSLDEAVSFDQKGRYEAGCKLDYNIHVSRVRLFGNRVEADLAVSIDCGTYKGTSKETVRAFLKKGESHAGQLKYVLSAIGPTVYVDLYTKIKNNFAINLRGKITGTGILGRLHEKFDKEIENDDIKSVLSTLSVC